MPPLSPSPLPPFRPSPPGQMSPVPPPGMDRQTKNIILFAVIFSALAAGLVLYLVFKPERKAADATILATSTPQTVATSTPLSTEQRSWPTELLNFFAPKTSTRTPSGPSLPQVAPVPSRTTGSYQPRTPPASGGTVKQGGTTTYTSGSGSTAKATTSILTKDVPAKPLVGIYSEFSSAEVQLELEFYKINIPSSPLRGKIWISSVARSTSASKEYITISTDKTLPASTDITGMTIKSVVSGQTVQIGKGVELPSSTYTSSPQDIRVYPGQKIIVTTGASPLGYSFRLNLCTGYFAQAQSFTPSLPKTCPLLRDTPRPVPPNQLQDPCIDYIDTIQSCTFVATLPKTGALSTLNDEQRYRCINFIQNNSGYQNCASKHAQDQNFYKPEWRAFLNWGSSIWKAKREVIWLLDQNGNFVSQYSY